MAEIEKILNKIPDDSKCPVQKKCGGCQLRNMSYPEQLRFKQAKVERLLGRFCHTQKIIGMENPLHYRAKVQAAFGTTRSGQIISGVYQSGTHRIVKVDDCLIEDKSADAVIVTVRRLLVSFRIAPFNEDTGRGFLRHVLVRRSFTTGQMMVVLVGASQMFPKRNDFVKALVSAHPEITTVIFNINDKKTNLVLGESSRVLFGKGTIEDRLCDCVFRISPSSFYQVNPVQTEVLYSKAIELAALGKNSRVIDAYCGTGTIGIIAAKSAGSVIGAELNSDAVRDARANAALNKADNIRFVRADAGEFMRHAALEGEHTDVLFMDPPRAGSDKKFLASALTLAPERIIYISCNPETLARDLAFLAKGYKVKQIVPVDMFPFTEHVETVVLMSNNALH